MDDLTGRLQATLGGNYRILRELGGGGMSRVFLAEESRLGRRVVIKVLPPDMAAGVNAERFEREIQLAASLQHPHIVQLLTAGANADLAYYVMPFIEGESLRARLAREGALPMGEVLRILHDVVDALAYSHHHGVVHRDIKPDNVMLSGKHALVTDFGVAKAVSASSGGGHSSLTSLGIALGTPAYMAPEQAAADPRVDHRADIYAVGVMAYEMLCGRTPFVAPTPQAMLAAHIAERPEPPARYRATIPPAMNDLVLRCLEKNPADRIQAAEEIAARLSAMATPTGGSTPVMTTPVSGARGKAEAAMRRSSPARVYGLFALAALAVVGTAFGLTRALELPDWIWKGAALAMGLGLPVIAYTGRVERKRAIAMTVGALRFEPEPAHHGLFTWKRALLGGALAVGLVALLAGGFVVSRAMGVGPGSTLMSAGVLKAQDRILLVDFTNGTSDSTLGASVTEALRIDLGQSNVVRLLDPAELQAALRRMGAAPDAKLDLALATDVARREGVAAIITGEITSLGSGYSIAARVVNAASGETLVPIRTTAADASQIIAAVDKLSKELREKVGESLGRIRAADPLEAVTTSSLEALRLYTEAVRAQEAGRPEDAVPLLRRAVAVDSTFAMAWRKLAVVLPQATVAGGPEAVEAARKAYAYRERLPPVERGLTEAYYFSTVVPDDERMEAAYRSVLAANPDEPTALNNLGLMLNRQGRFTESEPMLRRLVATAPTLQSGFVNLIAGLFAQSKDAAADTVIAAFQRRWPESSRPADMRRMQARNRHDFHAVDSLLYDPALPAPGSAAQQLGRRFEQLEAAAALGRLAEADRIATDLAGVLLAAGARAQAALILSTPAMTRASFFGEPQALAVAVDSLLPSRVLDSIPADQRPYGGIAYAYALAGQPDRVNRLREEWRGALPPERRPASDSVYWNALSALSEGRWRDAAIAYDAYRGAAKCRGCSLDEAARMWDRAGEPDSALARYVAYLTVRSTGDDGFGEGWTLGPAYQRLGELYEAKGDRQNALKYYGDLVELWRGADPALQPQVKEARSRMAALAGEN